MNTNISKIVDEWSYRLSLIEGHDGLPDIESYSDLTVLKSILTEYEWPIEACFELFKKIGNKVIIGEMSLDQKNVEKIYPKKDFPKYRGSRKVKPFSKAILNSANVWIADYIKKLEAKKFGLGKAILDTTTKQNIPQIKGGKPNRIQYTVEFPEIGRDGRKEIFAAAKSLTGDKYKTKYTKSKTAGSSAGSVIYNGKGGYADREDLEIWVSFKGGKSSKTAGKTSTNVKEGFVGLFFQSKWTTVVTKDNIGECVKDLLGTVDSLAGENSTTKSALKKYLKTIPSSNPSKAFLDELNQPLSTSTTLKEKYSTWTWERATDFDKVRKKGAEICGVKADKWNPGDVYLVNGSLKTKTGPGTTITTKIAPLNAQFVTKWNDTDGEAVSVSLKQKSAQAGKGKSYLKKVDGDLSVFDYNLTKEEQNTLGEDRETWAAAYMEQIDTWRAEIKSTLPPKLYDYKSGKSLMTSFDGSDDSAEFVFQKYASMKMFKFMVESDKVKDGSIFVDTAAFAAGLTGFNPTFFKIKSKSTGAKAPVERYVGNGGLEYVDKIKITDTNSNAGILFTFKVKNPIMGTADVDLNIRFNGSTQATLELLSVKW